MRPEPFGHVAVVVNLLGQTAGASWRCGGIAGRAPMLQLGPRKPRGCAAVGDDPPRHTRYGREQGHCLRQLVGLARKACVIRPVGDHAAPTQAWARARLAPDGLATIHQGPSSDGTERSGCIRVLRRDRVTVRRRLYGGAFQARAASLNQAGSSTAHHASVSMPFVCS